MSLLKKIVLGALGLAILLLAWIGILSVTRGTPLKRVITIGHRTREGIAPVGDSLFSRVLELYSGAHIDPGNRITVLHNGETFDTLWKDLRSAERTITLQMYFSQPGKVADTLATILTERSRSGVRVLLLFDAFGSQNLKKDEAWVNRLKVAKVEIAWLRPIHWYSLHKASMRAHSRAVVIDGRIGYTGGFGIGDKWLGNGITKDQWRDTNVRIDGPAAAEVQAAFAAGWAEATGELISGSYFFPRIAEVGTVPAGVLNAMPTIGSTPAERFLALAIVGAQRTLYIANSYFVPDDDFRELLIGAVKRGVDVRVLTEGPESDVQLTLYAGRAKYEDLMEGGVKLYEYQPSMMHSKWLVTDGLFTTIGSMNMDNRSLAFNNETNLAVLDAGIGAMMDSVFLRDLEHAQRITPEWMERLHWWQRVMMAVANLTSRLL